MWIREQQPPKEHEMKSLIIKATIAAAAIALIVFGLDCVMTSLGA